MTDGNCLPDALSQQLKFVSDISKTATVIRKEIVNFLRDNPVLKNKLFAEILDGVQPEE